MQHNILIVDDEADIRNLVKGILEDEGYSISQAGNSDEAYERIESAPPHLIVLDIWLQGSAHDGLEILESVSKTHPHIPILMISGHGTIETAVAAIKQGAYDFIEKPFKADRLILMVQRALEAAALKQENLVLKKQAEGPIELIGESAFAKNLKEMLKRVSATNSRVLLTGEAGTGKGSVARIIHRYSERAGGPFMVLNCASLSADRLETELFGSRDGAGDDLGVLESADKGTLLLDEVTDLPLETQGKILKVLQEQRFQRVGGSQTIEVDVRILATSNRDLKKAVEEGALREDLYYRLNVVPVEMPPLRKRAQDIGPFVHYFLERACNKAGLPEKSFSEEAMRVLANYKWPGNLRQLKNVVEWVMIFHGKSAENNIFGPEHLPPEIRGEGAAGATVHTLGVQNNHTVPAELLDMPLREAREAFERSYLFSQVDRFDGNISKTAQFIGMERSALHRKIKSLQVSEGDESDEALAESVLQNKVKSA